MSLRIRILRTLDECRAIRDDWARLVKMEGEGVLGFDVSATFEWAEALWQGFLAGAPQIVLVAEDASGVRGLLPCAITLETTARIPHRKLALISSIYDLRTGFLVGGDVEVLDCLVGYVLDELDGWDTFTFKVIENSPSDLVFREVMRRRSIELHLQRNWSSPYIQVPQDPAQVVQSLKLKMRQNVRRLGRQLSSLGELETRFYDTETSVPEFLDLMMAVEERSWKRGAGTSLTNSAVQQKLYGIVTPAIARLGWFLGAALLLDGRPLAYTYGYSHSGVFVGEKESYDDQYKQYGPGSVLRARLLEDLARRGIGVLDLGGNTDPNKAYWTDLSYSRNSFILFNRTWSGQLVRGSLSVRKRWANLRRPKSDATRAVEGDGVARLGGGGLAAKRGTPVVNSTLPLSEPKTGLRIRVLRTLDECRAIRDDWARLVKMEGEGVLGFDVSATFDWAEALWQGFLAGAPQTVLVAEDASGVRGLLPCMITPEATAGISYRKLALISSIYDLRTGFLVGGDVEVLDRLLSFLIDELDGWDTFAFKVVQDSLSDLAIRGVVRRRSIELRLERHWSSPYILLPQDPAQVFKSLKANMRANARRRDKQLGRLGKLDMQIYDTETSVPVFLNLMMVVEGRSWKQDAGTALTTSHIQQKLYDTVTPVLAKCGCFLGAALMLDDRPVAYIYGYSFAGLFVGEKGSYDERYKKYGPGGVLRARLLEELPRRGIHIYDLAGETDSNKAHWTDLSYSRNSYILFNRTLRAQLVRASVNVRKRWIARRGERKSGS